MRARAASPAAMLPMLAKIAILLPTHTRRSEESEALQQFSTPIMLGLAVSAAAAITPDDIVLEPSAGTGLLAILAELSGASLVLNELAETRAELLSLLFPWVAVTRFDAAHIDDHLDIASSKRRANEPAILGHCQRRSPHGRCCLAAHRVGLGAAPRKAAGWSRSPDELFSGKFGLARCLRPVAGMWRVVFSAAIAGAVFAKHGTTIETRLTVIDRLPAEKPDGIPIVSWRGAGRNHAAQLDHEGRSSTAADRGRCRGSRHASGHSANGPRLCHAPLRHRSSHIGSVAVELAYETVAWTPAESGRITEALYEEYELQSIRVPPGSQSKTSRAEIARILGFIRRAETRS